MSTFSKRVRIGVSLIERYGIKTVLSAARESRRQHESQADTPPTAPAFRRYQVFR